LHLTLETAPQLAFRVETPIPRCLSCSVSCSDLYNVQSFPEIPPAFPSNMVPNVLGVLLFVLCARALASLDNSGSQLSQDTAISLDTVGFLADKSLQKSRRVRRQSDCTIRPERAGAPSTESESPVQSRPVQTSTKEQPPKVLALDSDPVNDLPLYQSTSL
jgi:hypothetical protein